MRLRLEQVNNLLVYLLINEVPLLTITHNGIRVQEQLFTSNLHIDINILGAFYYRDFIETEDLKDAKEGDIYNIYNIRVDQKVGSESIFVSFESSIIPPQTICTIFYSPDGYVNLKFYKQYISSCPFSTLDNRMIIKRS